MSRSDLGARVSAGGSVDFQDFQDFPREGSWHDVAAHRAYLAEAFAYRRADGLGYWTVVRRGAPDRFLRYELMATEDLAVLEVEIDWRFRTAARRQG